MTNVIKRNTAWFETIRNFVIPDSEITKNEDNSDKRYQEWKKANADIIDEKAIEDLEKMIEHIDRKRRRVANNVRVEGDINAIQKLKRESPHLGAHDDEQVK